MLAVAHVEMMKFSLLLLILSACLLDFVYARGVAAVGKAGTLQNTPYYDHDPDEWYWTNRYFL